MSVPSGTPSFFTPIMFDAVRDVAVCRVSFLSMKVDPGLAQARGATDNGRLGAGYQNPRGARSSAGVAVVGDAGAATTVRAARSTRRRAARTNVPAVSKRTIELGPHVTVPFGTDGGVKHEDKAVTVLLSFAPAVTVSLTGGPAGTSAAYRRIRERGIAGGVASDGGAEPDKRAPTTSDESGRTNGTGSSMGAGHRCWGLNPGDVGPNQEASGGSAGGDIPGAGDDVATMRAANGMASAKRRGSGRAVRAALARCGNAILGATYTAADNRSRKCGYERRTFAEAGGGMQVCT